MRFRLPSLVFAVSSLALLSLVVTAPKAQADIVTFDNLPGNNDDSFTSFTEGNFTVSALTGDVRVGKNFGNPVPDIFGNGVFSVQVTRTGNQAFTFSSVDLASGLFNGSDSYSITGFLGANQVLSQTGSVSSFSTVASSGLTTVLDRLVISYTVVATSANVDNINVTPSNTAAPEPGSLALLLPVVGFAGMVIRKRRGK